jgi:pimeloyl-ACP methyl ester carboxylesterase
VTRHFKTSDGVRLAFDDQGNGTPLLCLSGLTRNREDFDTVLGLARKTRLIRLDYRGRGASDPAPDWQSYTVEREAQDVLELLEHLKLPKVAILGTSRGGLIAMHLAETRPDCLSGVFLNDIGPVLEETGLAAIRGYIGLPPAYADFDEAAAGLLRANAESFPDVGHAQWVVFARRIYRQTWEGLDLRYDPALREAVLAWAGPPPDRWRQFDALADLPVAVLRGEYSNLLSAETLEEMIRRHPALLSATVPNRGHVPFLDEAESVGLLDDFLEKLDE